MIDGERRSGWTNKGDIDYLETGSGPTVRFVPGSYSTHAAWRQIQRLLVQPTKWSAPVSAVTEQRLKPEHAPILTCGTRCEPSRKRRGAPATALGESIDVASVSLFETNPLALLREQPKEALHGLHRCKAKCVVHIEGSSAKLHHAAADVDREDNHAPGSAATAQ